MVKEVKKSPFKVWRSLFGALLTFLIVVPYIMGADVEKYLRGWMEAMNQRNGGLRLELQNYQRHWFTSDGDLVLTGGPLQDKIAVHFTAYHGPFIFNAGHGARLGLSYFKGSLESSALLGQQGVVKMDGPIQITAFVPYFKDRELHSLLPPMTITDKGNSLVYLFQAVSGSLDDDGLLQLEVPTMKVSRLDGAEMLNLNTGLLRIQPDTRIASFSAKEITLPLKEKGSATIRNFVLRANLQSSKPATDKLTLNLNLHFDQLKAEPLTVGPFEFKFDLSGLRNEGLTLLATTLKTLSTQKTDLTPEQGETLEKSISNLFAQDALFNLSSDLTTPKGKVSAQFQGGFHGDLVQSPWQNSAELVDAFYSKGTINMTTEVKQALSSTAAGLPQDLNLALDSLKADTQGYSTRIDIQAGKIILNGKEVKPSKSTSKNLPSDEEQA